MGRPRVVPLIRFWRLVGNRGEGCWLWLGHVSNGYGSFRADPQRAAISAHRFAYEELIGTIPAGLTLDHLCRVRNCVNPAHLEPVSMRTNTLRGEGPSALNSRKTMCRRGHLLDAETTYLNPRGERQCRRCHRSRVAAYRARLANITRVA